MATVVFMCRPSILFIITFIFNNMVCICKPLLLYDCIQRLIQTFPKRGVYFIFKKKKSHFKTTCFKKNQKIPRRNSKRKFQNMVKRKMTWTKLEIFCKNTFLLVYNLARNGPPDPTMIWISMDTTTLNKGKRCEMIKKINK